MTIAMRVRAKGGEIKLLLTHPSENGQRKDARSGQMVPAHFVKTLKVALNGKTVMDSQWSGGISKDPYLSFKVKGMKSGDKVVVRAEDNRGDQGNAEATAS